MTNALLVFLGGGAGSLLRYGIGLLIRRTAFSLPWATFISNMTACLIFAVVLSVSIDKKPLSPALGLLLLTGFCGGLSTFSTFGYETFMLLKNGLLWPAVLNVVVSTLLALFMFYILHKQVS